MNKHDRMVGEIKAASFCRVYQYVGEDGNVSGVAIQVYGPAGVIPSVSNSRMTFVTKGPNPRAVSAPKPEYRAIIEAFQKIFEEEIERRGYHAPLKHPLMRADKNNRLIILASLPEASNRSDTHNATKALCDLLQKCRVYENDRHVDAIARRAIDLSLPEDSLWVFVRRLSEATIKDSMKTFANSMISNFSISDNFATAADGRRSVGSCSRLSTEQLSML